jgi:hypothetical protein
VKVSDAIAGALDETPRTCAEIVALLPRELGATVDTVRSSLNGTLVKQGRAVAVAGKGRWGPTLWKSPEVSPATDRKN